MKVSLIALTSLLAVLTTVKASPVDNTPSNEGTIEGRGCCQWYGCGPSGDKCCSYGSC
ncbi:hypothetical protein K493DRAFT_312092 [Basidiobolus meristosporus CBS 931.73]|uniref:Uncharacterized protein n=1 Tax=Basidiobolus meristosporus CBS 931.73 TaxID=1314790 RepID=A0A1Y1YW92_9FUNG|nr:hypothetical protein K493DRAFT_312092 [Basidiobolus meristosporus CBS 931.73]|eukprot:ORY02310.1 hypothetical protein K493DRAFT_312092 [Basidiobolus meristosporus CBS 931.73]